MGSIVIVVAAVMVVECIMSLLPVVLVSIVVAALQVAALLALAVVLVV